MPFEVALINLETSLGIPSLNTCVLGGKIAYFHQNLYEITIYDTPCCFDWLMPLVTLWKCQMGVV